MKSKENKQTTQDKEMISTKEFVEAWQSHINEMIRLGFYLNPEDRTQLTSTIDKLNHLVLVAEKELKKIRSGN